MTHQRSMSPWSRNRKPRRSRHLAHRHPGIKIEPLEPRLLLSVTNLLDDLPTNHIPHADPEFENFTLRFTSNDILAQEGMGILNLDVQLFARDRRSLPGDVIVELRDANGEPLDNNPYFAIDTIPQLLFPQGTSTQEQTLSLSILEDDWILPTLETQFTLVVIRDGTGGQLVIPDEPLDVSFRGNDVMEVTLNGNVPTLTPSVGSLRLRINQLNASLTVQWGSLDTPFGRMATDNIVPTTWNLSGDGGVNPTRLVFAANNAEMQFLGNVLLDQQNQAVVDVVKGTQHLRYLLDDDNKIPCAEPEHIDLEVFARIAAYDRTYKIGSQVVGYGYVVDALFDDTATTGTGFQAAGLTCQNPNNGSRTSPVLATRGTEVDPNELYLLDVLADTNTNGVGYNQYLANVGIVSHWMDSIRTVTGLPPIITGHSLGGALAQSIAAAYTSANASRRLREVVTWNSPGIASTLADLYVASRVANGARHYINSGDIVSMAGERYIRGGYTMVESTYANLFDQLYPVNKHVRPMLMTVSGARQRPTNVFKPYNNVNWLNNFFFAYSTVDHYAVIGIASTILGGVGGLFSHPQFGAIPLVLVFRGTTEASRKLIGFHANGIREILQRIVPIVTQYQTTGTFEAKLPNITLRDPFFNQVALKATDLKVKVSSSGDYRVVIQGRGRLEALINVNADFAGANFVGISDTGLTVVGRLFVDPITIVSNDLWVISDLQLSVNSIARRIDASATILYGPQVDFSLPLYGSFSGRVLRQEISGTLSSSVLSGSGSFNLLGGVAESSGTVTVNFVDKSLRLESNVNILGNVLSIDSVAKGDTSLNLSLGGTGTVRVPNDIYLIGGKTIGSGSGRLDYYRNSGIVCVSGWGPIPGLSLIKTVVAGFRLCSNSVVPRLLGILGGPPIPGLPRSPREGVSEEDFELPAGLPAAAINVAWEEEDSEVPIVLVAPDGTVYDEAAIAADPNLEIVSFLGSSRNKFILINEPDAGIWIARVPDDAGLGKVTFSAVADTQQPILEISTPSADLVGGIVDIDYTATDTDSDASISLYYDTNRSGYDGQLITDALSEKDGPNTFAWDTSGIPTGSYYIYAVIDDGIHPPISSDYSFGRVVVQDPDAPPAVTDLTAAWIGADQVRLSWTPSPNAAVNVVRYSPNAAGEYLDEIATTPENDGEILLSELIPGETYRFDVVAVDSSGRVGPASTTWVVVGASPSVPAGPQEWEFFADPGTEFGATVSLALGDTAMLLLAPPTATLDAMGQFSWMVPVMENGFSEVVIRIDRADGTTEVVRRVLLSDPQRVGSIMGQVFNDLDADGSRSALEVGFNGFQVELFDLTTQATLLTMISDDRFPGGTNDPFADRGVFSFSGLSPGTYGLRIAATSGYEPTEPALNEFHTITVTGGSSADVLFGLEDFVAPVVLSAEYAAADGMGQMSEIAIVFSEDVGAMLSVSALMVTNLDTMTVIDTANLTLEYDPLTNTATWKFAGLPGGNLPTGTYRATLHAAGISDLSGNVLDGDLDGNPGGDFELQFTQPAIRLPPRPRSVRLHNDASDRNNRSIFCDEVLRHWEDVIRGEDIV